MNRSYLAVRGVFSVEVAEELVQNLVLGEFTALELRMRLHGVHIAEVIDGDHAVSRLVHLFEGLTNQAQSVL